MNVNNDCWDDADSLAECGRIPTPKHRAPSHHTPSCTTILIAQSGAHNADEPSVQETDASAVLGYN